MRPLLIPTFFALAFIGPTMFAQSAMAFGATSSLTSTKCEQSLEKEPRVEPERVDLHAEDEPSLGALVPCSALDGAFGAFCRNGREALSTQEGVVFCELVTPDLKNAPSKHLKSGQIPTQSTGQGIFVHALPSYFQTKDHWAKAQERAYYRHSRRFVDRICTQKRVRPG